MTLPKGFEKKVKPNLNKNSSNTDKSQDSNPMPSGIFSILIVVSVLAVVVGLVVNYFRKDKKKSNLQDASSPSDSNDESVTSDESLPALPEPKPEVEE